MTIGSYGGYGNNTFNGYIDELTTLKGVGLHSANYTVSLPVPNF